MLVIRRHGSRNAQGRHSAPAQRRAAIRSGMAPPRGAGEAKLLHVLGLGRHVACYGIPVRSNLFLLRLSNGAETVGLAYLGGERALRHLLVWSRRFHFNSPGEPVYNCLTAEDNLLIARPELESACWDAILRWFAHEQNLADELVLPGLRQPLDITAMAHDSFRYDNIALRSYHVNLDRLKATKGQFV